MNRQEAIKFYRQHTDTQEDEVLDTLITLILEHQLNLRDEVDNLRPFEAVLTLQAIKEAAEGVQEMYGKK